MRISAFVNTPTMATAASLKTGEVLNDETLELLSKAAVSCAAAGADIVAPSDMMDGRIGHMRHALDEAGYEHTLIMAYSVKYTSAFMVPSGKPQTLHRLLATERAIRWISETGRKPLWKRNWMWRKVQISSW